MDKKEAKEVMNYKAAQIKKAVDVKNEAIMISGSARDATLVVTTFYPEYSAQHFKTDGKTIQKAENPKKEEIIKAKWEYWQKYFYDQMSNRMPQPPTCSLCNAEMLMSSKGNWYCPNLFKDFEGNPHKRKTELPSKEQEFSNSLKP